MAKKKDKHPWLATINAMRVVQDTDLIFKLTTALVIIADDLENNPEPNKYRCATAMRGISEAIDNIVMSLGADAEDAVNELTGDTK